MTLQELITDLKAAGANDNTMQLAMNCYELGLKNATEVRPCCGEFNSCQNLCMPRAAAAEREACAKVCDDLERKKWETVSDIVTNGGRLAFAGPVHCAQAIRARGNK